MYNPHRSGKRGLKSQGTSKINLNCSVCIKAIKCLKTDTVIHNLFIFLPTIAKNSWDIYDLVRILNTLSLKI